jgi:hypothetical protein
MKLVSYKHKLLFHAFCYISTRFISTIIFQEISRQKCGCRPSRPSGGYIIIISYSTCYIYGAVAAPTFNVILTHYTVYTYQTPELIISINVFYYFILF